MPDSVLELILTISVLTPGYVWLLTSEKRVPRAQRSAVLEISGLTIVGATSTVVGLVFVAILAQVLPDIFLDFRALLETPNLAEFVSEDIGRSAVSGLVALALAMLIAWGAARIVYRGKLADISPYSTVWYDVFGTARGTRQAFIGVHLTDGQVVEGYLHSYPTDASDPGLGLALKRPVFVRTTSDGERREIPGLDHVIIQGDQVSHIGVIFMEASDGGQETEDKAAAPESSTGVKQ